MKEEKFPNTRKSPHRQDQGGVLESQSGVQQWGLIWQNRENSPQKSFLNSTSQLRSGLEVCLKQRVGAGCQGSGIGVRSQGEFRDWLSRELL